MVKALQRSRYFPVTFVYPLHGNEEAVGFDLYSDPSRRHSIDSAIEQRIATVSDPVHLVQLPGKRLAYLLFTPVLKPVDPKANLIDPYARVRGFILLVFVADELVQNANPALAAGNLFFNLHDISGGSGHTPILTQTGGLEAYHQNQFLNLLNRTWELKLTPSLAFLDQVPHWQSYAVLFAGWPFIMVLGVLLIMLVGRQIAVEQEVQEKTSELAAVSERALQASRAKSDFLANMSHELRTPLNSIIGFTHQVLTKKTGQLDARGQDSLQTVERNAKHLLSLINDLLDISKIEAGRFELNIETFEVKKLCEDVMAPFAQQAREKRLALQMEADTGITLSADRLRIFQVLLNLVSNAMKFTQAGSVLIKAIVEMRGQIQGVRFDVQDTGRGIPADQQPLLFNKFVQLEQGKQAGSGTGLGLALAKEIVTLHQGDIRVQSQPGTGSTFSLWIPDAAAGTGT